MNTQIIIPAKGFITPYKYPFFYEAWDSMRHTNYWNLNRINFDKDKADFALLTEDQRSLVKYLLCSFGINELAIGESWAGRCLQYIKNEEITMALTEIMAQEQVHAIGYHRLVDELNIQGELNKLYFSNPILVERTNFLKGNPNNFEETLFKSTIFGEAGSLFVSFFLLGDLTRTTGLLSALNDVNFYSILDEFQLPYSHYSVGRELVNVLDMDYKVLFDKYIDEFLSLETQFIDSLPVDKELKYQLSDYLMWRLTDAKDLTKCPKPMQPFEILIRSEEHTNFFERKYTKYTNNGYLDDLDGWNWEY